MVFYRKYRPQSISDLDSEQLRHNLANVFAQKQNNSIPHAFLFTGPKGLGKTSTARIVAKVINCEKIKKGTIEPCNICEQCVTITNGTNVDILEIDGASNRGIDEIRDLKEKIRLSPLRAKKKIYIIDEVHMLTTEAFNALLKTLEEPPAHVIFILCTTEPQKIPATIVSRCFHIQFYLASQAELVHSFERIVKGENLSVETDALEALALLSDGSFRDGAKLLEELAIEGKKITKKLVEEKYHMGSISQSMKQYVTALANNDTRSALLLISELTKQGVDMKFFLEQLLGMLHSYLLAKVGISEVISPLTIELSVNECRLLIELAIIAYGQVKYAVIPELPLEIMAIAWSEQHAKVTVPMKQPDVIKTDTESKSEDNAIWAKLIEQIKSKNHSVAGVLRSCKLHSFDGKSLVIETSYAFHQERLNQKTAIELLENACKTITGNSVSISVLLKS